MLPDNFNGGILSISFWSLPHVLLYEVFTLVKNGKNTILGIFKNIAHYLLHDAGISTKYLHE